jgi:hypothetical protein
MKPKTKIRRLLKKPPKNARFEKIITPVETGLKVRQGLADIERGAIVSLKDAESRLNRWIEG